MKSPFEFYLAFLRRLCPPPALPPAPYPDEFISYFQARGIAAETYSAEYIMPLTPNPSSEENAKFKALMRSSRISQDTGVAWIQRGILFEYPCCAESFAAARVFQFAENFIKNYEGDVPKMIVPKKGRVNSGQHLYILLSEEKKLNKHTVTIDIIEGQAKTLKLMQDFKTAGIADEHAVIGLQGAPNFIGCPETQTIVWRNRHVNLWFDADSVDKPTVAIEEIKPPRLPLRKGRAW